MGPTFKFWDPSHLQKAEARDLKFCRHIHGAYPIRKVGYSGSWVGSRDLLLNSATAYISQELLQLQSLAHTVCALCGVFDAAIAKLLWPLVTSKIQIENI